MKVALTNNDLLLTQLMIPAILNANNLNGCRDFEMLLGISIMNNQNSEYLPVHISQQFGTNTIFPAYNILLPW